MHVSHGLCTAVTPEKSTTSIQKVCGLFWASIGKTWSQKCSHEQASLAFTLYCRKLKWDGQATWHGCLMTACQNSSYMVSSATENDHLVGKRNASRTPLRRPSQASTLMWPTGKSVPRIDPCGAVWSILEQAQQKQTGSRRLRKSVLLAKRDYTLPPALQPARHTHAPSVEECCRPGLDWLATSALTGSTKHDIIIIIEEVMVIIGNDGRTTFFDNRLAVSSKHVSCVVDFRSDFFISKYMGSMQGCLVTR